MMMGLTTKKEIFMTRLRKIREGRKVAFSQYHLAALSGVDQKRISLIERDLVRPRPDEKRRIAAALETTVEELFGREEA